MSRRRQATKRPVDPDPRHGSTLISSLINIVMLNGKKAVAQRIVYTAIEKMAEKLEKGESDRSCTRSTREYKTQNRS